MFKNVYRSLANQLSASSNSRNRNAFLKPPNGWTLIHSNREICWQESFLIRQLEFLQWLVVPKMIRANWLFQVLK